MQFCHVVLFMQSVEHWVKFAEIAASVTKTKH